MPCNPMVLAAALISYSCTWKNENNKIAKYKRKKLGVVASEIEEYILDNIQQFLQDVAE